MNFTELLSNPNVQAFLRVIRAGETSQDDVAYRMMFGGELFDDFSHHPNIVNEAVGLHSTAAGAYQFLYRTWQALCAKYDFPDFSPHSQDLGAIALIIGRGAIDDVQAGRFDEAIAKCNKEWASLPGSPYGQTTRTLSSLREVYVRYGGTLASGTVQSETVTDTSDKPAPIVESKPTYTRKPMAPFIGLAFEALSAFIPQLAKQFGGTEVSDRNIKGIETAVEVAKKALGAANEQELIDKIHADPAVRPLISEAIEASWFTIIEVGGGIPAARVAALETQKAGNLLQNPALWVSVMMMVPVYAVLGSVIGFWGKAVWDSNALMLVLGFVGSILSGILGYWLGSSFVGNRKTDLLNSK